MVAAVVVVEIVEASVIVMEDHAEGANREVVASEAEAVVEVEVVGRNAKEIGPAEIAATRTLPGEMSAIGVNLLRVMVPLEEGVVAVVGMEVVVVAAVDRLAVVNVIAEVEAVVVSAVTAMEDMVVAAVVPCAEATEIATNDNGRIKAEFEDIPD